VLILAELSAAVGLVLTYVGLTSLIGVRLRGPAKRGSRYAAADRHAPTYVRVGPALLAVGVVGIVLFR
jgi:hypothetical protein